MIYSENAIVDILLILLSALWKRNPCWEISMITNYSYIGQKQDPGDPAIPGLGLKGNPDMYKLIQFS